MRKLPIYLVLETSASMGKEAVGAMEAGCRTLVVALRQDPCALEIAYLSVITFGDSAKQIVPLTELAAFEMPEIKATGTSALGDALKTLCQCIDREVITITTIEEKKDWEPIIFIMTEGRPTDYWQSGLAELQKRRTKHIVACVAGHNADINILKQISENVIQLDTADSNTITSFFRLFDDDDFPISSPKAENNNDDEFNESSLAPSKLLNDNVPLRKVPVFILIPNSIDMQGESIGKVYILLQEVLLKCQRKRPELFNLSIATFNENVDVIVPLMPIDKIHIPKINISNSSTLNFIRLCEFIKNSTTIDSIIHIYANSLLYNNPNMDKVIARLSEIIPGTNMVVIIFNIEKTEASDYSLMKNKEYDYNFLNTYHILRGDDYMLNADYNNIII